MSKAYLQGYYDYFHGVIDNPYYSSGHRSKNYWDWEEGYDAAYVRFLTFY